MLNLRKSFNGIRKRNSSSASLVSESAEEHQQHQQQRSTSSPIRGAMEVVRGESLDSPNGHKHPVVSINELQSFTEGDENGLVLHNGEHTTTNSGKTTIEYFSSRVREVIRTVTRNIVRLDDYDEAFVKETDLETYLQHISDERLIHMPKRGSDWDRVLSAAQFFGIQIWSLGEKIDSFVLSGTDSAAAALASCQILLEIGHGQAQALLPTFIALHELAMLLCTVGQIRGLEQMSATIKEDVTNIFCDLIVLINSIAIHYQDKVGALRSGSSVTIDFDATFGKQISAVWSRKQRLHDHVWAASLGRKRFSIDINALRTKLLPPTEISSSSSLQVRSTLYDEVHESLDRVEDTCHWIKHEVVNFLDSQDQVLSVTGNAGSGKTVLAEWVQERLTRPLGHKNYVVLDYTFPFDSDTDATALASVKSLVNQLLERSVGNVALYEQLVGAFESYDRRRNADELESSLWNALRSGLQALQRNGLSVVIITDGCDVIPGDGKPSIEFHDSLRKSVQSLGSVRVITFSRPLPHLSEGCRRLAITPKETLDDARSILWSILSKAHYFSEVLDEAERQKLVDELADGSKGNLLWAFFAGRLLQASNKDGYLSLKQSISTDIKKLLQTVITKNRVQNQTLQHLLSFMLVVSRPLSVQEAVELLAINTTKQSKDKTTTNLYKLIPETIGDLVLIRSGRLHFRSSIVSAYLREQMGTLLLSLEDAHRYLTLKTLLYARLHIACDREEPVTGEIEDGVAEKHLESYPFLLYVMQNWTVHFKASGFINSTGKVVNLPKGIADFFPGSVTFALLERAFWRRTHRNTIALCDLSLQVREAIYGEKHISVLQCLVNVAHSHRKAVIGTDTEYAGVGCLVRAVKLGQVILSQQGTFVTTCTSLFLTWTEIIVVTKRTQVITYREEMIRVMIQISKHRHGNHSDQVIFWYETLAKLYIDIDEQHHATVVYRELYEIIVIRYGKKSTRARQIGTTFGTLDVVLKGEDAEKDVKELEVLIFETNEDMEVSDQLCITMMIRLAQSYVACGKLFLAERLYISLWRRISAICGRGGATVKLEIHLAKIQIALEYVKFLKVLRRSEEATNILICLWTEYKHHDCQLESLIIRIREIGTLCRAFGLLEISVSIFTKVWGWFKSKGKGDSDEARKTTILITEVVEEVTETTVTKKTTKITTTEVTETVVKEIFELHLTRCKKAKVDKEFFSACIALIGIYIHGGNWTEAETIIKRTLEITWKAVLTTDKKITLTENLIKESIFVARRLALCYHRQGLFEQAEQIYLRVYYACLHSITTVEEAYLTEAITVLIEFYEEHHRHDKIIQIYTEVLGHYRKHYGHGHRLTIQILYKLAAQYELLGNHTDSYKYYLEIVTVLNKGLKHCHRDAVKAALFLCRHYHTRKMWTGLREICTVIWETFVHHRDDCVDIDMWETIVEVYEKYTYVLEVHFKVEFSILYEVTIQYKEVITTVCGGNSKAALLALIALAKMCEKHESHYHESITVYEEVIKKTTTVKTTETIITETTIHTVKKRLSTMYVTVITTGKGSSVTTGTIERAIEVCLEAYAQLKLEFGCWHDTTLHKLKEVVILYQKVNTKASHVRIVEILQTSVTEIISTLTVTSTLVSAAITLASIYVTVGFVNKGQELLHHLHHLVIFRNKSDWIGNDITLKLDVKLSKIIFAFLVAFEQGLQSGSKTITISYSEMMADMLFEYLLYEQYSTVVEKETKLEIILESGAKLRYFWAENKRTSLLTILDKKLLQVFRGHYSTTFQGIHEDHVRIFYLALIVELGSDQRASIFDIETLACKSGNQKVKTLLQAGEFRQAYEVGSCLLQFVTKQRIYHRRDCFHFGYKLAELLAGVDIAHPKDGELSKLLVETSVKTTAEVFAVARREKIDFATLRFEDLSGLIRLLGAQKNYVELEALLLRLWERRESLQKSGGWSPTMVVRVGSLLVHAQHGNNHTTAAITTAELLYYNIRRSRGRLDSETLAVSQLLASLYLTSGRVGSAMGLHESLMREVASACSECDDEKRATLAAESRLQLDYLKEAHVRSKGQIKPIAEFKDVYERLRAGLKLDLPAFQKWADSSSSKTGQGAYYSANSDWTVEKDTIELAPSKKRQSRNFLPSHGVDFVKEATAWCFVR